MFSKRIALMLVWMYVSIHVCVTVRKKNKYACNFCKIFPHACMMTMFECRLTVVESLPLASSRNCSDRRS